MTIINRIERVKPDRFIWNERIHGHGGDPNAEIRYPK